MKFKRETHEIEGGRKLYRYVFGDGADDSNESESGKVKAETSDSKLGQEEPKGTSEEEGGR